MEAFIVKNLSHNLFSIKRINNKNCKVVFNRDYSVIYTQNIQIFVKCNGSLYKLDKLNCLFVNETSSLIAVNVRHKRLGHLNHAGMRLLDLPLSKEKCAICKKAKKYKNTFPKPKLPRINKILRHMRIDKF